MRSLLISFLILGCCVSAEASLVLVDFSAAAGTPGGLQGGNYWNTIGDTSLAGLVDAATGTNSGWKIQVGLGGGNTGFGGTGINGDGAAAPFDQSFAITDGIYSNRATAAGTATVTLSGLAANTAYDFSTYSDRSGGWADSVITPTTGTGPASVALTKDSVSNFTITSSGSGKIAFSFVEGPDESANAGDNSVLNALSMSGPASAMVPIVHSGGNGANLVTTAGGDLWNPDVSSTTTASIGSNANDNNHWGSGSTAGATGPDIGSTWRFATLAKVGAILDASDVDALTTPADLNQPLAISLTLAGQVAGANTSGDYAPLAYLYGIDQSASGTTGWWGTADATTQSVNDTTPLTAGVWDATEGTWTFGFLTDGLITSDIGDILGIAIVGNQDAIADEWLRFGEGIDSFLIVQQAPAAVPEPSTFALAFLGLLGAVAMFRRRRG